MCNALVFLVNKSSQSINTLLFS